MPMGAGIRPVVRRLWAVAGHGLAIYRGRIGLSIAGHAEQRQPARHQHQQQAARNRAAA